MNHLLGLVKPEPSTGTPAKTQNLNRALQSTGNQRDSAVTNTAARRRGDARRVAQERRVHRGHDQGGVPDPPSAVRTESSRPDAGSEPSTVFLRRAVKSVCFFMRKGLEERMRRSPVSRANRLFLATDFHLWQVEKGGEAERKELSVALAEKDALLEELQDGIKAVQVCEMLTMKQMRTCNFFHKLFQRIAESLRQACVMNGSVYLIMADLMDAGGGGQAVHQTSEGA
jgi:hypothetical protein